MVAPLKNYSEETRGDFFYITITNPKTDWRELIKTLGEVPFTYEVKEADNVVTVKVDDYYNRVGELRNFKAVFHKAAACIGCGVCESNCQFGAISFKDGLHIENCRHCLQCHDIDFGCLLYNSARFFLREGYSMKSFNTFGDHAPKPEWLNAFFDKANEFFKVNSLGPNQMVYFKRFLSKNQIISRRDLGRKSNRLQRRI